MLSSHTLNEFKSTEERLNKIKTEIEKIQLKLWNHSITQANDLDLKIQHYRDCNEKLSEIEQNLTIDAPKMEDLDKSIMDLKTISEKITTIRNQCNRLRNLIKTENKKMKEINLEIDYLLKIQQIASSRQKPPIIPNLNSQSNSTSIDDSIENLEGKDLIDKLFSNYVALGNDDKCSSFLKTLKKALEKLAEDIYSSNNRFISELIQNADDNQYDEATPFFEIHFFDNAIWTCSNEKGFNSKNVRAICNVDKSTKGEDKIGNKGIGFKSVFKVTKEPHIFSPDYNFKFLPDLYIIPQWVEDVERGNLFKKCRV